MGSSVEQNILVTGGAGFIGTHTVVQLLKEGFKVSIIDNLDNSVIEAVDRVRELVGPDLSNKLEFNLGDLRNKGDIEKLFSKQRKYLSNSVQLSKKGRGDASAVYGSTERSEKELGWKAKYGVDEMCRDQWNWANNNPWGYQKKL
ncbi:hypothetical protein Bca52824_062584 [Brassica carinata]|uniref:UDP-glucose 4-epimerase n=1 Tax=Brassica carinata TaxID=52824 RepID=A0A8X7QI90_BRACI|nr:hypothetical protein Bca52824_062584 [Brassica carinata]